MSTTDYAALVKDDRVHTALYKDSAIFDEEMERIFKNTWVWVGHESELPGPNTFKKSFVGNQPVIVTRDKAGEIRTLLNRCRHRAASVCERRRAASRSSSAPIMAGAMTSTGACARCPMPTAIAKVSTARNSA
jgi:phenylpropionate dioxygenase-like ring-hydroxylating dioxygenase large terminal subunit